MIERVRTRMRKEKKNRGTEKEKGEVNDLINDSHVEIFLSEEYLKTLTVYPTFAILRYFIIQINNRKIK